MERLLILLALAMGFDVPNRSIADTVPRALMLKEHGLVDEAKVIFIEIAHSDADDSNKATSLYHLGLIAFNEKRLPAALATWNRLTDQYPTSPEAGLVSEQIDYLAQEIADLSSDIVSDVTARLYLKHGEFWSGDIKETIWTVDSNYLDHVKLACDWYDKVIREFSGTDAAKKAHTEKFKTISGKNGIKFSFNQYIEPLLAAYQEFEKGFPRDGNLPAMKYQIAQAYWREGLNHLQQSESQKKDSEIKQILAESSQKTATNFVGDPFLSKVVENSRKEAQEHMAESKKKLEDSKKSLELYEDRMMKAKEWLNQIIEKGDSNSFYTRLATARLNEIISKEKE